MTRAVFDKGYQLCGIAILPSKLMVHDAAKQTHKINILPLVVAPDIVNRASFTLVKNLVDGVSVILDIKPVPDICALPIDRQRPVETDIVNYKGNQFFG